MLLELNQQITAHIDGYTSCFFFLLLLPTVLNAMATSPLTMLSLTRMVPSIPMAAHAVRSGGEPKNVRLQKISIFKRLLQ